MDRQEMRNEFMHKLHLAHAFWSYDKSDLHQISDETMIASVLQHLDIDDVMRLFELFPKTEIRKVWEDHLLIQEPFFHGLNRLYAWLLFDISDADKYIRTFRRNHLKSLQCRE